MSNTFPRKAVKRVYPKPLKAFRNTRATIKELQARVVYLTDVLNSIIDSSNKRIIEIGKNFRYIKHDLDTIREAHNEALDNIQKNFDAIEKWMNND